jgi:hypothetical protein
MGLKLGDLSPVAGIVTGKGMFGKMVHGGDDDKDKEKKQAEQLEQAEQLKQQGMKKGGKVKKMAKGGTASSRADGCCVKGKTRGKMM